MRKYAHSDPIQCINCTILDHPARQCTSAVHCRQVLVTVDVEVEVFLRQFVVGTVFTQLSKRFVEGGFQLGIVLTQADTRTVTKVLFVFHGRASKSVLFARRLFQEAFARGDLILECRIQTACRQVRVDQILVLVRHHVDALLTPVRIGKPFLR